VPPGNLRGRASDKCSASFLHDFVVTPFRFVVRGAELVRAVGSHEFLGVTAAECAPLEAIDEVRGKALYFVHHALDFRSNGGASEE
jgi:hypothetical protein